MKEETMYIQKESARTSGSCNACNKYHEGRDFDESTPPPYDEVNALYVGKSHRQQIRFCDDCLKKLVKLIEKQLASH